jgi:hypothetical protein
LRPEEEGVIGSAHRARLRGQHVDPARSSLFGPEPGVRHADRNQPAGAGHQRVAAAVQHKDGIAFEDVEAFLEGVHVGVDAAAGLQRTQANAHMDSANDGAVYQGTACIQLAVAGIGCLQFQLICAKDVVHATFLVYQTEPNW